MNFENLYLALAAGGILSMCYSGRHFLQNNPDISWATLFIASTITFYGNAIIYKIDTDRDLKNL